MRMVPWRVLAPLDFLVPFFLSLCLFGGILVFISSCASDPYPNDRSMARMSVAQLTLELSKP